MESKTIMDTIDFFYFIVWTKKNHQDIVQNIIFCVPQKINIHADKIFILNLNRVAWNSKIIV